MARAIAATALPQTYRLPLLGIPDPLFRKCLRIALVLGVAVIAAAYLAPKRAVQVATVDTVPDRFAKLILEEPKAPPVPPTTAPAPPPELKLQQKLEEKLAQIAEPEPKAEAPPKPKVTTRRRDPKPTVPENRGTAGREQAKKEVAQQLATVKSSVDEVLSDLSTSLSSTKEATPRKKSNRRRRTRGGRSAGQLASVGAPLPGVDAGATESSISGSRIVVEEIANLEPVDDATGSGSRGSGPESRNEYRSDASLLSVVRRYAPGIQLCYDSELRRQAGLAGKLVVAITVAPSGRVTDTRIARDTVGSAGLVECALDQVRRWKFPEIAEGTVTFHAPFVFTPPE